jgi:hypothetical protein
MNADVCRTCDRGCRRASTFFDESETMMTETRKMLLPLASLALCLPLTGCPDDDDDVAVTVTETTGPAPDDTTVTPPTTEPPTTTEEPTTAPETETETETEDGTVDDTGEPEQDSDVRFVHLSPDAPAVDIYLDPENDPAVTDLAFTDGTPFEAVPQGTYDVRVTPTGDDPDDAVLEADGFQIPPGGVFTVAAFGELDNLDLMVVGEDDAGLAQDTLRAFVGHAADGVPTVDVWAIGLEDDPVEVLSDLEYGDWQPLDIPAETAFTVGLDADADGAPDFEFDIPPLPEGITISLFAVLDATSPFLIAYLPDGSAAGPIRPND